MVEADDRRITWTATEAGYSFFNLGRRIGAAEYVAADAYLVVHRATGAALRCRSPLEAAEFLAIVEDADARDQSRDPVVRIIAEDRERSCQRRLVS